MSRTVIPGGCIPRFLRFTFREKWAFVNIAALVRGECMVAIADYDFQMAIKGAGGGERKEIGR